MLNTATDAIEGPAFVVRLDGPAIVEANARARAIWGIAVGESLPIAIDGGMPAIRRLAAHAPTGVREPEASELTASEAGASEPAGHGPSVQLVFWTHRGAQRLQCRYRYLANGGEVLVVVDDVALGAAEPDAPKRPPAPQTAMPAPRQMIDLHTMAHELRTPIGAVIALADMIDQQQFGPLGDPRYREYARDIRDSAHLALNIVAAALEQDHNTEAILLGGITEIAPDGLLRKTRRALRLNAQAAGLALEVEAAPGLPLVLANPPGLTQILLNLTANAIKFTPPGGHITLSARHVPGGALAMSVRDTGIGMTELETSVLVETAPPPPAPLAGESDAAAGGALPGPPRPPGQPRRGIGFTLIRRLADAMGATLEVTSERGVGTCVSLTFPASLVIPDGDGSGGRAAARNGE